MSVTFVKAQPSLPKKVCRVCQKEKERSEFSKNRTSRDGLVYFCKECSKAMYQANKNKCLAYQAKRNKLLQAAKADEARTKKLEAEIVACQQVQQEMAA